MAIWYLNYLKEKENNMGVYGHDMVDKQMHTFRRDPRYAEVYLNSKGFYVKLYEANVLVETRDAYGHSESWAESMAENWVDGVLNV